MFLRVLLLFIVFACFHLKTSAQFYSGTQQEFGKNRVQYRSFNWLYYEYGPMKVYFYQGGEQLAAYSLEFAVSTLPEIEKLLDYPLQEDIQIVIYNKQNEFRQSNVGITGDDQYNIGGSTRIVGSKVFVYYEGSHEQLEKQIRAGLARILLNQMMYGGDWKEVFKNSTLLSIPEWYSEGFISYAAEPWGPETEAYVKDGIISGNFDKFNRLTGSNARYAGHSVWKYVADVYGESVIPNILYMTRISRNIENGFLFVLGTSLNTLIEDYQLYYRQKYDEQNRRNPLPKGIPLYSAKQQKKLDKIASLPDPKKAKALAKWEKHMKTRLGDLPVKYKKKYSYDEFHLSPDGKYMVYATDEMGQYKVWLYDVERGKLKRIYKREYKLQRIVDDSYPIISWHPSSKLVSFVIEHRGRAFIVNYNLEEKKILEKELFRIDKVIDMNYSTDGKQIIFSGVKEGQTDLYLYYVIGNKQDQITNDIYDDMHPSFIKNSEAVIFASNRPDDTLRSNVPTELFPSNKDIYIYYFNSKKLERVTNTPEADEAQPFEYDSKHYTYLSDEQGVYNRYLASVDSAISRIDTTIHYRFFTVSEALSTFNRSALEYNVIPSKKRFTLTFQKDGRFQVFNAEFASDRVLQSLDAPSGITQPGEVPSVSGLQILEPKPEEKPEVDIDNYVFEDDAQDYDFERETVKIDVIQTDSGEGTVKDSAVVKEFVLPKSANYRVNFATDFVLSQIDNTFTNRFYQQFSSPTSISPGLSGLIKLGMSDLFEDYKVIGGFRLSGSLDNNDYGLRFEKLDGRLDKIYTFQRQSLRQFVDFSALQFHTHTAEYQLRWPFNELRSIRGSIIYRNDRRVVLSTDLGTLAEPNVNTNNLGLKFEYVFDNTINKGLNLFNGTRYKLFAEYYQETKAGETDFGVIGADFRHYEKIHRDLILALRLAGNTSFGSRKLVHYLGGVDNWLFQKIDNGMPIPTDQNFVYQTLASPMRGFYVNSRNGTSFAVANAELRWPVFKYLLNKPIKSDFVENFQIVGFGDVGSAWTGTDPYSDENAFNTQVYQGNPVTVTIDNNREPIIYGYGFGLRSRVLGYFVRADWSWGIDDGMQLPRVFYLSLNLDF